jgi:hypothetical protein
VRFLHACLALLGCIVAAGCDWITTEPQAGFYRAVIEVPGGELPFGLELAAMGSSWTAYLVDGAARVPVERLTSNDGELELVLPGARSTLRFTTRGKHLSGTLLLEAGDSFAFSAERDAAFRFFPEALTDNADAAGRWSLTLTRATTTEAVADLVQSHDQVAGTIYEADSARALTGQIQGEELRLSAFDGSVAILLVARIEATGELKGEYWSSDAGAATLSAYRNPDAVIEAEAVASPEETTEIPLFRNY